MSAIAVALKHMLAAGMAPEAIVAAVTEMEAAPRPRSPGAERTARWRARRAGPGEGVTGDGCDGAGVSPEKGPHTPKKPTPSEPPPSPPMGAHGSTPALPRLARPDGPNLPKTDAFARFWEAYPAKVGKRAAATAFVRAVRRIGGPDPPAVLLAAVERARLGRRWRLGFVPNPQTWLNQDRWNDEIEPDHDRTDPTRPNPNLSDDRPERLDTRGENLRRMLAGAVAAVDRPAGELG